MPRLVIDVTELAHSNGNPTGVTRVINELGKRYINDADAIFVAWSTNLHSYYAVDNAFFYEDLEPTSISQSQKQSMRKSSVNMAKNLIRRSRLASRITEIVMKKIHRLRTLISDIKKNKFNLAADDVLVIMADWHAQDPLFVKHIIDSQALGVKIIQLVHDLLPISAPQYSGHASKYVKSYVREIYPLCSLIVAISENTKKEIIEWLKTNSLRIPPVETIRLGDDFSTSKPVKPTDDRFIKSMLRGSDYILCVGTIEARKNHALLYYTYKLAKSRNIKIPKLIIVGRMGWMSNDVNEIILNDPDTKDSMIILNNVDDNQLSWLYDNCIFSIYPSFCEGWGLPIAESVHRGVPCVCSNTSSMPEVAGNLAVYFNPYSPEECLNSIQNFLNPITLRNACEKLIDYKPTSWQETYTSFQKVIAVVLNDKNSQVVNKFIKVLHVTSHNEECGIARYQEQFISGMVSAKDVHNVFFDHSPYETRFMSRLQYDNVLADFRVQVTYCDILHIQHELAFYKHRELGSMIRIARKLDKRVIVTIHTALDVEYKIAKFDSFKPEEIISYLKQLRRQKMFERIHLNPIKKADLLIVHNNATKDSLIKHGFNASKIKVIRMPIPDLESKTKSNEISKSLRARKGDIIYCTVGFISRNKGVDQAVKALLYLPKNYKLAIIGGLHPRGQDEDYLIEINKFIGANKLQHRVFITGYINEDSKLNALIDECNICVYPYDSKYYSYVSSAALSNAIANRKPVVAYPTSTFKELNKEEQVIVFCKSPNAVELAKEIEGLDINKQARISSEYADKHNYIKESLKFADLYRQLLNGNV